MDFLHYKDSAQEMYPDDIMLMLSEEQIDDLNAAKREYECYATDPFRHDGFDGEENAEELCALEDDLMQRSSLEAFFKKYPGSDAFDVQLKTLLERY